jgi:hypothetical protein
MSRGGTAGLAFAGVAVAAGMLPAGAAAITFDGETAKGVAVELRVNPQGTPRRFEVAQTKVRCRHGTLGQNRRRYGRFDRVRIGHFADRFRQRNRDGRFVLRERTRYEGDARNDGTWRGTYEVNVRVNRKGERIDTCHLRTTWTASRNGRQ